MNDKIKIVVPWHDENQIEKFLAAWRASRDDNYLVLQQDADREGCAKTKNKGIKRAYNCGADVFVVLDDDCFPDPTAAYECNLWNFAQAHCVALEPQPVEMFEAITSPPSRGTPYRNRSIMMLVAASLGFWKKNPDYDASHALVLGETHPIILKKAPMHGKYFAGSGMNFAFRREWIEFALMIDVPRFDDILAFLCWQKIAYEQGFCFNLNGPTIVHERQSNLFANNRIEAFNLEANEHAWKAIHEAPRGLGARELREIAYSVIAAAGKP